MTFQQAYARLAFVRHRYGRAVDNRVRRRIPDIWDREHDLDRCYLRLRHQMVDRRERLTAELEAAEAALERLWNSASRACPPIADIPEAWSLPREAARQFGAGTPEHDAACELACRNIVSVGWTGWSYKW
jgi:hypothetical protein